MFSFLFSSLGFSTCVKGRKSSKVLPQHSNTIMNWISVKSDELNAISLLTNTLSIGNNLFDCSTVLTWSNGTWCPQSGAVYESFTQQGYVHAGPYSSSINIQTGGSTPNPPYFYRLRHSLCHLTLPSLLTGIREFWASEDRLLWQWRIPAAISKHA